MAWAYYVYLLWFIASPVLVAILWVKNRGLMADTSKLTAAVAKLQADVTALLASSANDQPSIDAATAAVTAVDASVVAATPAPPAA